MHILNIAEKPSVAKSISKILSQSISSQRGKHKYCPNITFTYNNDTFVFTSVLGHIYSLNFHKKYLWEQIDPKILFEESLVKNISEDFQNLKNNIELQALKADKAIIWTDCDREGEHIALQISNIIKNKKNILIKRARFSGISRLEIENALNNLQDINLKEADAVDCRMEMDLRIGSSFTIFQTLAIKDLFSSKKIISFGPCQIPTLGFVVERYLQISNFKEENIFSLELCINNDKWTWKRNNLFDKNCVAYFYNSLSKFKPVVVKKEIKQVSKLKPLPLRTVELQKLCSSFFKISSHKVMEISESLYNKGYISYPRTETDAFAKNFDFKNILNKLSSDSSFSSIISNLANNYKLPRSGKNNDLAHSPIYPLKHGNDLSGLDRTIYEFVARRFLGSLCEDAKGIETYFELVLDREMFYIKGLEITDMNYLNVYTYDKWNNKKINDYILNTPIQSFNLNLLSSKTSPPLFLTESELINLMDKNGIGTDATIHEHIQKIQERSYASKYKNYILPQKLGIGLIKFYEELQMKVGKPFLRKDLEDNLKKICNGEILKGTVLRNEIRLYLSLYSVLENNKAGFRSIIEETLNTTNNILDNITKYLYKNNKENDNHDDDNCNNESKKKIKKTTQNKKPTYDKKTADTKKPPYDKKTADTKKPLYDKITTYDKKTSDNISNVKKIKIELKNADKENIPKYNKEGTLCMCNKEAKFYPEDTTLNYKCFYEPKKCNFNKKEEIKCFCKYEPKILISYTENNKNRRFYKCKKSYKPCNFFKWAE